MRRTPFVVLCILVVVLMGLFAWTRLAEDGASVEDPATHAAAPSRPRDAATDSSGESSAAERNTVPNERTSTTPSEPASDDDTRRQVADGPRGRVVSAETDEPVEGVPIHTRFAGKSIAETVTDAEGRFRLPKPERRHRRVEVASPEWRAERRSVRLSAAQASGEEPIVFRVVHLDFAPLTGVLLDRNTDEPIPDFTLALEGPWRVEESANRTTRTSLPGFRRLYVVTDESGSFASDEPCRTGTYEVLLHDAPPSETNAEAFIEPGSLEIEHAQQYAHHELRIGIGPTYRLDLTLPDSVEASDLGALFPGMSTQSREMHRMRSSNRTGLPMSMGDLASDAGGPLGAFSTPVRDGSPTWIRFRSEMEPWRGMLAVRRDRRPGTEPVFELQVRSLDGAWRASATVDALEGVYQELVPMRLERVATLEGVVRDARGEPIPVAWIEATPAGAGSSETRGAGADERGAFEIGWLAEGEHRVTIFAEPFDEWTTTIDLDPEGTNEVEAVLVASEPVGEVSGIVRGRSRDWHPFPGALLRLRRLDADATPETRMVSFERGPNGWSAPFSFERVPVGEYELRVEAKGNQRWNRDRLHVSPPITGVEFVCDDDAPTIDLEIRPVDSTTGEAIEPSWAVLWMGDPVDDVRMERHWDTELFDGIPRDEAYSWLVRAHGYRLARGDETDFRAEDDRWVLDVALEPGWGQAFRVTTESKRPLEGVALHAGGERIGTTDAHGLVLLDLAEKPTTLRFEREGWHVVWGDADPTEEGFGEWGAEEAIHMAPK